MGLIVEAKGRSVCGGLLAGSAAVIALSHDMTQSVEEMHCCVMMRCCGHGQPVKREKNPFGVW